jgi:hypothetical protein
MVDDLAFANLAGLETDVGDERNIAVDGVVAEIFAEKVSHD